jgi:alanyl-tRNA synthetase
VIEIWNVVFIQYNREPNKLQPLPAQHVDTGMGLERLVSILQDCSSNYDIDCFQPLFDEIETVTTKGPYTGKVGADDTDLKDTAYRAVADHARCLVFAIADGAVPANEGRGYVLRRILRRAARYGQQILGAQPGFFTQLAPVVVDTFGGHFPELIKQQTVVEEILQEEEEAFSSMLGRGIKFFAELEDELKRAGTKEVPGAKAFYLYDTLGFPIDLTELMAEEAGLTVDTEGFAQEMEAQKQRSREAQRAARAGGAVALELIAEQTAALTDAGVLPTDDGFKYKWDVELPATVMAVFGLDGFLEGPSAKEGDFVGLILDKTAFYAEAGGQEADLGSIDILDESGDVTGTFSVTDVQVYGGFVLHTGVVEDGEIQTGTHVNCRVDYDRRRSIAPNHSMTHVLNAALRQVLGDSVDQRGSLCNDEKLRFDFSYKKALTAAQLKEVEGICQRTVKEAQIVTSRMMPLEDAKKIKGVRAVFGEVYPDPVRVISIGDDTSVEFCGGTHLENTAEAEAFVLVEETAVAKGIRRVTAVTKEAAVEAQEVGKKFQKIVEDAEQLSTETPDLDKTAGAIRKDLDSAFLSASLKTDLRARIEGIQKKATDAKKKALQKRVDTCLNEVKKDVQEALNSNKKVLVLNVDISADSKASQRVMNAVKDLAPDIAFLGLSEEEPGSGGKLMAFASVPESLVGAGLRADEWVRAALDSCGGRGGGRPGNAQGQAKECEDVTSVLAAGNAFAESKLEAYVL